MPHIPHQFFQSCPCPHPSPHFLEPFCHLRGPSPMTTCIDLLLTEPFLGLLATGGAGVFLVGLVGGSVVSPPTSFPSCLVSSFVGCEIGYEKHKVNFWAGNQKKASWSLLHSLKLIYSNTICTCSHVHVHIHVGGHETMFGTKTLVSHNQSSVQR